MSSDPNQPPPQYPPAYYPPPMGYYPPAHVPPPFPDVVESDPHRIVVKMPEIVLKAAWWVRFTLIVFWCLVGLWLALMLLGFVLGLGTGLLMLRR